MVFCGGARASLGHNPSVWMRWSLGGRISEVLSGNASDPLVLWPHHLGTVHSCLSHETVNFLTVGLCLFMFVSLCANSESPNEMYMYF